MNDAQRRTIISALSKEIGREVKVGMNKSSDPNDRSYYDHLWETLEAFDAMWDNLQMVKEANDE